MYPDETPPIALTPEVVDVLIDIIREEKPPYPIV